MKTNLANQLQRLQRLSTSGSRRIAVAAMGACGIALLTGCVGVPVGGYSDSYYYGAPAPAPSVYYQESYYGGGGGYYGGRPYYGGSPVYGGVQIDNYRRGGYDGRYDRGDRGDRGRPGQGVRPGRPTQPSVNPGRPPNVGQGGGGGRPINQGAGAPVQYGHTANPNQGTSVQQGNN